jgi:hypothetical protein
MEGLSVKLGSRVVVKARLVRSAAEMLPKVISVAADNCQYDFRFSLRQHRFTSSA